MNIVILKGNVGQSPEVRNLESGVKVSKFSFATNENYKDKTTGEKKQITEWHSIVAWRGLAQMVEKYVKQGASLLIQGKITYRKYQKDDETRYYTEIIAQKIELLDKKSEGGYFPSEQPGSSSGVVTERSRSAEAESAKKIPDLPDPEPSPADATDELPF